MNNDSYRTYVEKVQLLLLRVYWLLVLLLMMQMLTSVPAAIAAAARGNLDGMNGALRMTG